ncbi:alpha/beta fold hydrolase [Dactylosporangium sp. NPDC000555]|uniref:alpha/beta fold hydrolase n=1 Tax=Dactylosporangium sp. NPDC000555 TaxID=3154260 RepID=UPI0033245D12
MLLGALPGLPQDADELIRRLDATTWPSLPADETWANGAPMPLIQRYSSGWARWLEQPRLPPVGQHEIVEAETSSVHVVRFEGSGRVPILLLHGWPTSFLAFHRVIEPLRAIGSELVLASLPGFGTTPLPSQNWSVTDSAALLASAMERLGHDRFVVHGQDWGSVLAREIGAYAPDRVIAVHVSAGLRGVMADGTTTDSAWVRLREFAIDGAGYLQLQSRRPDSLAFALADSPTGLLAWQLDKYQLWQSALGEHFGLGSDFIFANATLYWLTRSVGSSMRIYAANRDVQHAAASRVPTAVSVFGNGDFASSDVASRENNLVAWYEHTTGGHVAALDAPTEFVADLTDFIHRTGADR